MGRPRRTTPRICCVNGCDRETKAAECPMHRSRMRRTGTYDQPTPRPTICTVDGCNKPGPICPMHRTRMARTGTTDARPTGNYSPTIDSTNGYYRICVLAGHPLNPDKYARTIWHHRVVLFDAIGYGPHRCVHCGAHVNWRRGLIVDHLDDVKTNNHPDNLAPSCNGCNIRRGYVSRRIYVQDIERILNRLKTEAKEAKRGAA